MFGRILVRFNAADFGDVGVRLGGVGSSACVDPEDTPVIFPEFFGVLECQLRLPGPGRPLDDKTPLCMGVRRVRGWESLSYHLKFIPTASIDAIRRP